MKGEKLLEALTTLFFGTAALVSLVSLILLITGRA